MWEVYAVRYAHHERTARENFLGGDPHDDSPMPMDYFVWALVSGDRVIVVDTGSDEPFPSARYHVQDREMQFCTGRSMGNSFMRFPFEEDDVVAMVRRVYGG